MRVSTRKLKPNPFRKALGPLSEIQIQRLIESFKMSDFGKDQRFEVRKNENDYEIVYGHHRLAALKKFYGNIQVEVILRNYDDKMMLQELLRENLTQEDRWFSRMKAMVLTKKILQDEKKPTTHPAIARFLSRDEQTVNRYEVHLYLSIAEKLDPKLLKEVIHLGKKGQQKKGTHQLGIKQAYYLTRFPDYSEQNDLAKALKNCYIQDNNEQERCLSIYHRLSLSEKKLVREGKINLAYVPNLVKPQHVQQVQQLKPQLDKTRALLKKSRLASRLYANLLDLRETLDKTKSISFKKEMAELLYRLYWELGKELIRQSKLIMIEKK